MLVVLGCETRSEEEILRDAAAERSAETARALEATKPQQTAFLKNGANMSIDMAEINGKATKAEAEAMRKCVADAPPEVTDLRKHCGIPASK